VEIQVEVLYKKVILTQWQSAVKRKSFFYHHQHIKKSGRRKLKNEDKGRNERKAIKF
jgi:hypothetical protein